MSILTSICFLSLTGCHSTGSYSNGYRNVYAANNKTMELIQSINLDNGGIVSDQISAAVDAAKQSSAQICETATIARGEKEQATKDLEEYHSDVKEIIKTQQNELKQDIDDNQKLSDEIASLVKDTVDEKFTIILQQIKSRDQEYDVKHSQHFDKIESAINSMIEVAKTANVKTDQLQENFTTYKKTTTESLASAANQIKALQDLNLDMQNKQDKALKEFNEKLEEHQKLLKFSFLALCGLVVSVAFFFLFKKFWF